MGTWRNGDMKVLNIMILYIYIIYNYIIILSLTIYVLVIENKKEIARVINIYVYIYTLIYIYIYIYLLSLYHFYFLSFLCDFVFFVMIRSFFSKKSSLYLTTNHIVNFDKNGRISIRRDCLELRPKKH